MDERSPGRNPTPGPLETRTRNTVYGYISLEHADETQISRLHDQLTDHARAEGLALAEIFVDRCMPPGRIVRPGLTVLLDAIVRADGASVLVASLDHLSSLPAVRRAIEVQIEVLGAHVLTAAAPEAGCIPDGGQAPTIPVPRQP